MKTPRNACFLLLSVLAFHKTYAVLETAYMEDLCMNQKIHDLRLDYQTSGMLAAQPVTFPDQSFECTVQLTPGRGASVVLSILRYSVDDGDLLTIMDSDGHKIALLGRGYFPDERKSVISDGSMTIHYFRGNGSHFSRKQARPGFTFVFTKAHNGSCFSNEFKCTNGKCIQKRYSCDGHNHCGDMSDQKQCVPTDDQEREIDSTETLIYRNTSLWISIVVVAGIILGVIVIVIIVVSVRYCRNKKPAPPNITPQNSTPSTNPHSGDGGSSLQSVSSSVPQQIVPSGTAVPVPVPSAPERDSLYGRMRRSFRNDRAPNTEEVQKEQRSAEMYQVPSMYPSLDQLPSAPEMYGMDNPDFKIEE